MEAMEAMRGPFPPRSNAPDSLCIKAPKPTEAPQQASNDLAFT